MLLSQSLGRPGTSDMASASHLPETEAELRESWADMESLAAVLCADQIEAVARDGGAQAVRERINAFDEGARRTLHEALSDAPG